MACSSQHWFTCKGCAWLSENYQVNLLLSIPRSLLWVFNHSSLQCIILLS